MAEPILSTHLPTCLLCGSKDISVRLSLSAENINESWLQDGRPLPKLSLQKLREEGMVYLYQCQNCGFQFFNPKLAGDEQFYDGLHTGRADYYAPDRPENKRNASFAIEHGYKSILDVGCGVGFALDTAKSAGLNTYGIELSRAALTIASGKGHTVFSDLLENLTSEWEGKFDMISLNQVLEHVPDPAGLVRQCVRFLSHRGAIAIAVPSATGVLRFAPWLPANWPPHHISWWRREDFVTLAKQTNLKVIETGGNQLLGSELESALLEHRQNCKTLKKPNRGLPTIGIKLLGFFYRKTGMKHIFKSQGHSIYCYLSRQ